MHKRNFIGFRDRVFIHLLRFEKEIYENIHNGEVDGEDRDFLIHLTQEGIAGGVGTKQSTIYKELQTLRKPAISGEEALIDVIEKARIPGRDRVCAIYYLTQYGHDLAAQKKAYLEDKNLEVIGLEDSSSDLEVVSINKLIDNIIGSGYESNEFSALLRIASVVSVDGKIVWKDLIAKPEIQMKPQKQAGQPQIELQVPLIKKALQDYSNPYFNRTAIKKPEYFYGRIEEVQYIFSLLRNHQSCSIVGPRRCGKSSLINYVSNPSILKQHNLNPDDFIFIPIDLEGLGELTQGEFFSMIIEEIRNKITDSDLRMRIEQLILKESIRFLDLKNILRDISQLDKNVIFLFDEFELITNNKNLDCNFYSGLRNLANAFNVGYITSSHFPLLELTFTQETLGSPFFNFFTQMDLGLLDEKGVNDIIAIPSKQNGIDFSDETKNFIKDTAGPHAFFLQILCFHAFNWMKEHGSISKNDFQEIRRRFSDEARPHFQYFWSRLSDNERSLILSILTNDKDLNYALSQDQIHKIRKKGLIFEENENYHLFSDSFKEFLQITEGVVIKDTSGAKVTTSVDMENITTSKSGETIPKQDMELNIIPVQWGNYYFVDEDEPNISVNLFKDITKQGLPGLFITRTEIKKAESQWEILNGKIIWLCSRSGSDCIRPALERISHTIFEFINSNERSIVFLDGIEYIVNNNDFFKTLSLIDNIKENVAIQKSLFIFPISSSIFSQKEMALLKKNTVEINQNNKLDLSRLKF